MTASYPNELKHKISRLKQQQQKWQSLYFWRACLITTFAGAIFTALFSPAWRIQRQSQITITGDGLIDSSAIYRSLSFTYPQSIFTIPTQNLHRQLESIPALESVRIIRNIYPPSVNIFVTERKPIAAVINSGKVGFLDSQGIWLEPKLYEIKSNRLPLTAIEVVNYQPQYSETWSKLYGLIQSYPHLKIREVHWDDIGNLSLKSQNYQINLGSDSTLLDLQFETLARFPDFATNSQLQDVTKIDLLNPNIPSIERQND